ncbi:MAG: Holliday junction branch migration protein RuvA [Patescibacteria group bacterium]
MIFSISGKIKLIGEGFVAVDTTSGVSYQIYTTDIFCRSVKVGQSAELFTYLHISREETINLYGFPFLEELDFFKKLNNVPSIGPKSAMNVLSLIKLDDLKKAIINESYETLTKVSGIGRKIAERIIIEMKGKIKNLSAGSKETNDDTAVVDALVNLGYSISQAREMVRKIPDDIIGAGKRVKEALKMLNR